MPPFGSVFRPTSVVLRFPNRKRSPKRHFNPSDACQSLFFAFPGRKKVAGRIRSCVSKSRYAMPLVKHKATSSVRLHNTQMNRQASLTQVPPNGVLGDAALRQWATGFLSNRRYKTKYRTCRCFQGRRGTCQHSAIFSFCHHVRLLSFSGHSVTHLLQQQSLTVAMKAHTLLMSTMYKIFTHFQEAPDSDCNEPSWLRHHNSTLPNTHVVCSSVAKQHLVQN
mmetsp:Transcript_47559/g.84989  ORF Transcript_47559/g.84989 Transcript_47559/m.84989 type:complete len:222 (+) Transcript_47559:343-1008(+)